MKNEIFLTLAFDSPTCDFLNKNCLFKLLTSMVSMSICKQAFYMSMSTGKRISHVHIQDSSFEHLKVSSTTSVYIEKYKHISAVTI